MAIFSQVVSIFEKLPDLDMSCIQLLNYSNNGKYEYSVTESY